MKSMRYSVILLITFSLISAVPIEEDASESDLDPSQNEIYSSRPSFIDKCSQRTDDLMSFVSCTAQEILGIIRKVSKIRSFEIFPGIAVSSINQPLANSRKIEPDQLPLDPQERFIKLMELIFEAAGNFISGRTIRLQFPELPPSADNSEERKLKLKKKEKKLLNQLLMLLGIKLMASFPFIGVVGAIAIKALIAAKLALIVASVLGIQSLVGNRRGGIASLFGGGGGGSQVWVSPGHGDFPSPPVEDWGRSLKLEGYGHEESTAQSLAYSQQKS